MLMLINQQTLTSFLKNNTRKQCEKYLCDNVTKTSKKSNGSNSITSIMKQKISVKNKILMTDLKKGKNLKPSLQLKIAKKVSFIYYCLGLLIHPNLIW